MNISVFGLGKLGSPLAAVLAAAGHNVVGYDVDAAPVDLLRRHIAPCDEPGLQDVIDQAGDRLAATTTVAEAIRTADALFIIVPTPSKGDGGFSCRYVCDVAREIGKYLPECSGYKLIVLVSTVMPGDTDGEMIPIIESMTDMTCGKDFGVCYSPEFIALGDVIRGLRQPDYLLIGSRNDHDASMLEGIYRTICVPEMPPVRRMTIMEAELTKLAQNVYVTAKMSFANMLAEVCEKCDCDAHAVTKALGTDHRIGPAYIKPGPAFGGPCFPRDNRAFTKFLGLHATLACLPESTDLVNRHQTGRLADIVLSYKPQCVGILGLSYKPDTSVTEESAGINLERELQQRGIEVIVHDPQAERIGGKGTTWRTESVGEVLARADVVVITTPWPEYRRLPICEGAEEAIVVDCWSMFPDDEVSRFRGYYRIGKGPL